MGMKKEYTVWVLWLSLLGGLWFGHLVPALLTGMVSYACVHNLDPWISRLQIRASRNVAAFVVMCTVVSVIVLGVAGIVHMIQTQGWIHVLDQMKMAINSNATVREWVSHAPIDIDNADSLFQEWIAKHKMEIANLGKDGLHIILQCVLASIIGALYALESVKHSSPSNTNEYQRLWRERVALWYDAFSRFVGAQVKIAGVNAVFTAIFLLALFPLFFGAPMPMVWLLIPLTFVCGLIPILGNIISNTILTVLALGVSLPAAIGCLLFLFVIHKLEYLINAKIMGASLDAKIYEMLAVIVIAEACFGIPGVVMGPIVYGYIKNELAFHEKSVTMKEEG